MTALCPLQQWYAGVVTEALLHPLMDSRLYRSSLFAVEVVMRAIAASDGVATAGQNVSLSRLCQLNRRQLRAGVPLAAGEAQVVLRQTQAEASTPNRLLQASSDAGGTGSCVTSVSGFSGSSAGLAAAPPAGKMAVAFSVGYRALSSVDTGAVEAALLAVAARAGSDEQLQGFVQSLAAAAGLTSGSTSDSSSGTSADVVFMGARTCAVNVTVDGAALALSTSEVAAGGSAATVTIDGGGAINPLGIAIGAAAGVVLSAALLGLAFLIWHRRQRRVSRSQQHAAGARRSPSGKLMTREALAATISGSTSVGADGLVMSSSGLRMHSNPSVGALGAGLKSKSQLQPADAPADGQAQGLRLHSNPSLAMYASQGQKKLQLQRLGRTAVAVARASSRLAAPTRSTREGEAWGSSDGDDSESESDADSEAPSKTRKLAAAATRGRAPISSAADADADHDTAGAVRENPLHARLSFHGGAAGSAAWPLVTSNRNIDDPASASTPSAAQLSVISASLTDHDDTGDRPPRRSISHTTVVMSVAAAERKTRLTRSSSSRTAAAGMADGQRDGAVEFEPTLTL